MLRSSFAHRMTPAISSIALAVLLLAAAVALQAQAPAPAAATDPKAAAAQTDAPEPKKKKKPKKPAAPPPQAPAAGTFPVTIKLQLFVTSTPGSDRASVANLHVAIASNDVPGGGVSGNTDPSGEFRADLAPGTYNVTVEVNSRAIQQSFRVSASASNLVLVSIPAM